MRLSASGWYYAVQHVRPGRPFWPRCAHSPQLWPQPRVTPLIRGFHSWRERSSPPTVRRLWPQCGGYAGHFHESPPSVQRRDVFTPGAAHFVISARGCSVPVWSRSSHSLRDNTYIRFYTVLLLWPRVRRGVSRSSGTVVERRSRVACFFSRTRARRDRARARRSRAVYSGEA